MSKSNIELVYIALIGIASAIPVGLVFGLILKIKQLRERRRSKRHY